MKLKEALSLLEEDKKGWVKRGRKGGWSEYNIQYLIHHETGELCWTAGGTAGGKAEIKPEDLDEERWYYFTHPRNDMSIVDE